MSKPAFRRPGFEDGERFFLASHRLGVLWPDADGQRIDAVPRIHPRPAADRRPRENWVDLEHARMDVAMQPLPDAPPTAEPAAGQPRPRPGTGSSTAWQWRRELAAPGWQFPQASLLGVLPQQQPFREDVLPDVTLVFLPDEDEEQLVAHRVEDSLDQAGQDPHVRATLTTLSLAPPAGLLPWGAMDVPQLLERVRELAEAEELDLREAARRFTAVEVPNNPNRLAWEWHPWLGLRPQA